MTAQKEPCNVASFLDGKHQFYTINCRTRNMLNVYKHPIREGQRGEVYEFVSVFSH